MCGEVRVHPRAAVLASPLLETGSLSITNVCAKLVAPNSRDSLLSLFRISPPKHWVYRHLLYKSSGDLNSGLQTCTASTSPLSHHPTRGDILNRRSTCSTDKNDSENYMIRINENSTCPHIPIEETLCFYQHTVGKQSQDLKSIFFF